MKEETGEETSQGNQNSDTSSGSNQKTEKIFELKKSGILANSNQIDWEDIKLDIENMYVSIPTMTIDLYSINVNQEDILAFNKEYDNLILVSKDEDKTKTVQQLSKLYEYIPKFINNTSSSTIEKKKIQTKSDIFKAYSKLDSDNWNDIYNDINNAVTNFSELLTDTNIDSEKQYSINKVYILLNELKNAVPLKDKELFLIKYKNLIERIDTL